MSYHFLHVIDPLNRNNNNELQPFRIILLYSCPEPLFHVCLYRASRLKRAPCLIYICIYIYNIYIYIWITVCVCVFFPSILDIKFVGRTSRGHTGGRSHRIFNPPSFCGACLDFCREKDSAIPFPPRPWSRILCTNELIVLHPLGIFILVF